MTYTKKPVVKSSRGRVVSTYEQINRVLSERIHQLKSKKKIIVFEYYPGVFYSSIEKHILANLPISKIICSDQFFISNKEMDSRIQDTLTDDEIFGVMSHYRFDSFIDEKKITEFKKSISSTEESILLYGVGASALIEDYDLLLYADLPRWEIQKRQRAGMYNWKTDNGSISTKEKYKRGYFFEWRIADRQKQRIYHNIDYLIDTIDDNVPKLVSGEDYRFALSEISKKPFRVVPYFDSSVWGGQWMKERFKLDQSKVNYGWAFDGVPEENSLLLKFNEETIEIPAINLIFAEPKNVLGEKVQAKYGNEFPIRFDYLDTFKGENLSLQVHPTTDYIFDRFGMRYTQDESYYILDATEHSYIYLGLKNKIDVAAMKKDLIKAKNDKKYIFPAEKYINKIPVKKHDHYSIPAGTIHCSGPDTIVLEISATPNIFTFKLWDWDRLDLDGEPRPIHLEHGLKNIDFDRDKNWVEKNLIHEYKPKHKKIEYSEKTGLHEFEPIETVRHWFSSEIILKNHCSVNVLNVVEGEEIIIQSLNHSFEEIQISYGETVIIPASVLEYKLINCRKNNDRNIAVLQAYVRTDN